MNENNRPELHTVQDNDKAQITDSDIDLSTMSEEDKSISITAFMNLKNYLVDKLREEGDLLTARCQTINLIKDKIQNEEELTETERVLLSLINSEYASTLEVFRRLIKGKKQNSR